MSNIQQVYEQWREVWEIGNPKPKMNIGWLLKLQLIPAIGSVLLSGTRTGNVVAELGSFSSFGQKLGYLGLEKGVFVGLEALLTFLTFEAAIFLAGALTTEKTRDEDGWNWAQTFLWVSLIPVLIANIYPGLAPLFTLLDKSIETYSHTFVNSVVGISTTLIVFVSGRVIKQSFLFEREVYNKAKALWETKRKRAWTSSTDLKSFKTNRNKPAPSPKVVPINQVLNYMQHNGQTANMLELPTKLNLSETEVFNQVTQLTKEGKIARQGMNIRLLTNE